MFENVVMEYAWLRAGSRDALITSDNLMGEEYVQTVHACGIGCYERRTAI